MKFFFSAAILLFLFSSGSYAAQRKVSCKIHIGSDKVFDQTVDTTKPAYFLVVGKQLSRSSEEALLTIKADSTLLYIDLTGSDELRVGASHLPAAKIVPEVENIGFTELPNGSSTQLYVHRPDDGSISISCFRYSAVTN